MVRASAAWIFCTGFTKYPSGVGKAASWSLPVSAPALEEIRIELEKAVYDVLHPEGIEFAAQNQKFKTAERSLWSRVRVQFGKTRTLELGIDDPLGVRDGILLIQIFLLPNADIALGEHLCSILESAFRYKRVDNVHCEEPYSEESGLDEDNAWYQFNVTIPFWTWIGK
jgi:hypothetical protein